MRQLLSRLKYYAAIVLFLLTSSILSVGPAYAAANDEHGPNSDPAVVVTTQPISAKALTSHDCNAGQWQFVITQVDTESDAPSSVHVTWANNDSKDVSLTKFTGGVAHYVTTDNLNSTITSATANIYSSWSGQFNLSDGPCTQTPPVLTLVTPLAPTGSDVNCDVRGEVFTPDTQGGAIVWTPTTATLQPGKSQDFIATPATGYYFANNATSVTFTVTNTFDSGNCPQPPVDVCPNIDGDQAKVPKGYEIDSDGNCVPKKVFVCKYVGTPGVDERLQTGQNPIDVDVNSINVDPVLIGSTFSDAQSHSVVIAFDTGQGKPDVSQCPAASITPVTPTTTEPTCANPNMIVTPPAITGVIWTPSAPTTLQPGQSVTYVATPATGYSFPVGAQTSFMFTNHFVAEGCGGGVIPVTPTVSVTPGACVQSLTTTGSLTVMVTNPNAMAVTYTVTLGLAGSHTLSLAGGASGNVMFSNLIGRQLHRNGDW